MLQRLGGVDRVARDWVQSLKLAQESAPGSRFVLDSYSTLLRLIEFCESRKPQSASDSVENLSDEQLRDTLRQHVIDLVRAEPRFVIWAAAECGWEVVPPPATDNEFHAVNTQTSDKSAEPENHSPMAET